MDGDAVRTLILRWRDDPIATYRRWFDWPERPKNFRSIRRGVDLVVEQIEQGTFNNQYQDSSLKIVVGSIAEQRQIFKGADHAFLWKPKLGIPAIYEHPHRDNQVAFGMFLKTCAAAGDGETLVAAIHRLDALKIKGLGPAVANILYFLHPTLLPPFNTAIVKGYNALAGARVRLGSWEDYLAMREGIQRLNDAHRDLLSNDLGAISALLFDVGRGGSYTAPPTGDAELTAWKQGLQEVRTAAAKEQELVKRENDENLEHADVQEWLRDVGRELGFDIWIAANDRRKPRGLGELGEGCLSELPAPLLGKPGADRVRLIDVLWFPRGSDQVAAAFEVEHTTSVSSGILRMYDLAKDAPGEVKSNLYVVAPDKRAKKVREEICRCDFLRATGLTVRFLPYGELQKNRDAIVRFGQGLKPIETIAQTPK